MFDAHDMKWMEKAIQLAEHAASCDEVPVGAVIVLDNQLVGEGFNQPISSNDPTAHAEIIALRQAAVTLKNYRLLNTTLYVTLEPCMMCASAMVHARIKRLVYGATDPKTGAIVSKEKLLEKPFLNHRVSCAGGLLAERCGAMLSAFFAARRAK